MIDYKAMANCRPKLQSGMVWCRQCGRSMRVDAAKCLAHGWPKCCGYTMTIDAPESKDE